MLLENRSLACDGEQTHFLQEALLVFLLFFAFLLQLVDVISSGLFLDGTFLSFIVNSMVKTG